LGLGSPLFLVVTGGEAGVVPVCLDGALEDEDTGLPARSLSDDAVVVAEVVRGRLSPRSLIKVTGAVAVR
jgi:hypothetical protein